MSSFGGITGGGSAVNPARKLVVATSGGQYTSNVGNVEFNSDYAIIKDGDLLNGTATETSFAQAIPVPGTALEMTSFVAPYLVPEVIPGDLLAIRFYRDATGGNPDDTSNGNVVVVATELSGKFWR